MNIDNDKSNKWPDSIEKKLRDKGYLESINKEIISNENFVPAEKTHPVMRPGHYNQPNEIEAIEFIGQVVKYYPPDMAYHIGNSIKYLHRAPHKGALHDDIDKAINYLYRARHGVWLDQRQPYKLTAAQKEQLEIFQAIQTEIKVVNGDPDEAEYIGNHVMELIKEYEREYLKMGKKKSAKKDEMIQVIKSVMQNELMHDVITEKELEKVLRNLSKPMQRSLEEAGRRKREN